MYSSSALVDLQCRLGEEPHHLGQLVGIAMLHLLKGHEQHGVARENGRVGIPTDMHGGKASPLLGTIHQVVVQ